MMVEAARGLDVYGGRPALLPRDVFRHLVLFFFFFFSCFFLVQFPLKDQWPGS